MKCANEKCSLVECVAGIISGDLYELAAKGARANFPRLNFIEAETSNERSKACLSFK